MNPADALRRADMERHLRTGAIRGRRLDFTACRIIVTRAFAHHDVRFGQHDTDASNMLFQCAQSLREIGESCT